MSQHIGIEYEEWRKVLKIKKEDLWSIMKLTEQPEFNNEGKVDQNAEQCHDIRPLPAKLTDNMTTKLSNQSLESENVCLKKTVAQCQKDFAKLEAHCINLELQLQMENNVLKSGQQSQFFERKRYCVHSYRGWTQSLVAKKKDISENRASRNFDLMIIMTPVLIVSKAFDSQQIKASVFMDDDVSSHQFRPRSSSRQELELLFHHQIAMLRSTGNGYPEKDEKQSQKRQNWARNGIV
ncbi:hypothetical protein Tco_0059211 [Tanacetum coccineum]